MVVSVERAVGVADRIAAPPRRSVYLVEDHELVRRALRQALPEPFVVVGEAASGENAFVEIRELEPDLVVLDRRLPDADGLELCRDLHDAVPRSKVVVLTADTDPGGRSRARAAGAIAYLDKSMRVDDIVAALTMITGAPQRADEDHPAARELVSHLTLRERRVLELVSRGLTNREIAQRLYLSERTVRNYVSNLLRKLGLRNRTEAAVLVMRLGADDA